MSNFVISVGHCESGAVDSGAVGILNESNCTREIGSFAKSYLEKAGHTVTLARIDRASSINASLEYRVNLANSVNADVFAEIHLNSGGGVGTEVFCVATGGKAEKYAKQVLDKIVSLGYRNRGVKTANFYVLRKTVAPAILIECCFVNSQEDANRYNAEALGKAIAEGLINSTINTITTQSKPTESVIGGEEMRVYKNGSTPEIVYMDSEFQNKIGALDVNEQCEGFEKDGKVIVYYNAGGKKKVGFVKYNGLK